MRYLIVAFFFLFSFWGSAQEQVEPIIRFYLEKEETMAKRKATTTDSVIFFTDTLELPFVDDFSKNRIRSTVLSDGQNVRDSVFFLFTVNGVATDSAQLVFDTTYTIVSDTSGNTINPNPMVEVVVFNSALGIPIDTLSGWPTFEYFVDASGTTATKVPADTILVNRVDSIRFVFDSAFFLWTGEAVFWNNSLTEDQLTYGVVSFDGTAKDGLPHDPTSVNSYGLADELRSKPINLDYPATDSIFLSFFYQPGGLGEEPNQEDSLTLQFYSPSEDEWRSVWSSEGKPKEPFEQVFIFIDDSIYLKKGFQFRFRNYATLSGSFDMWHLDYVQLARFRNRDEAIDDLAIKAPPNTYLRDYTSVPWKQYKRNPSSFVTGNFLTDMYNLSPDGKIFTNYYRVYDEQGQLLFTSSAVGQPFNAQQPSAPSEAPFQVQHFLNSSSQNNFRFPTAGYSGDKVKYFVEHSTNTTPDQNSDNDTIVNEQVFNTYFSYDDGVAEQAYSLNEAGAMIAYKFDMPYLDTLKAVLINFPDMLEDMSDRRFKIMVWRDLDEAPIYEGVLRQPVTTGINKFNRFALSEELILSSGEFYVGWLQTLPKKLYVGFDFNNDHQQEIFYSVNNGIDWFNTSFQGSLLIRPDFGYASVDNVGITEVATPKDKVEISVYPNPATTHATIVTQEMESLGYRLMDVSGRMIHQGEFYQTTQLSLQGLQTGVYFLHIFQPLSGISQVETIFVR